MKDFQSGQETADLKPDTPNNGGDDIIDLAREVESLKTKNGNREVEKLNLGKEQNELTEAHDKVFGSIMERVKKVMEFLVVKPVTWLGNLVKNHPVRTALIIFAGFGLLYFGLPLSAGLSGLGEEGIRLTTELLTKLVDIDPSSLNVFDDLFTKTLNAPPL